MKGALPKDLQSILDKLEPALKDAFLEAINNIRNASQLGVVIGHLQAGRIEQALIALRLDPSFFDPVTRLIGEAFVQGGRAAVAQLPRIPDPFEGGRFVFAFDSRRPRAEKWVSDKSSRLITAITNEQRETVRSILLTGLSQGRNPRDVALDIVGRVNPVTKRREGGVIGLTGQQASFVQNAREELKNLDGNYFLRTRRDKRYDASVRRAIKDGKPLPSEAIETIVGRYSDSLLQLRGETIARTEALNAMRSGMDEAHSQLTETGKVTDDQVTRVWDAFADSRTRPHHRKMDGQKVGKNEPFTAPDGSKMMFPGDTSLGASAAEVINCRCIVRLKIDFFKGLT